MAQIRSRIAQRVQSLPPSGIRRFFELVEKMPEAISLGIGEPDFVTPWRVREAGIYSLERGHTHYTPNRGIRPLLEELARYLERRFGVSYDPETELMITVGGSEAIDVALRSVLEPGEGVLIPQPCFVSYQPCAVLAGGRAIPVATSVANDFQVQVEELAEACDDGARVLLISYPSNPTGAIMPRAGMERLLEFAAERDLLVISDEVYAELTYDGKHASAATVPGGRERTILVGGFSKAWAMTGWRLGFAAGPAEIIGAMVKVHSYAIMCSPTTAQEAAIEALRGCDDDVAQMRQEYNQRRRVIVNRLNAMGLTCFEPKGAFYAFPSIAATGLTSEEFAQRLLEEQKVAVVPGPAFGACGEGFIRCSYATSMPLIEEAMTRMAAFVGRVGGQTVEIIVAENAGFCFGVKRALELVARAADDESRPVYTLGALIHNPQEIARLEQRGVHQATTLDEVNEGAIVLSAHGVDPEVEQAAGERGLEVIDATCPFVKRAHSNILALSREGYAVVILGDRGHREVEGLAARAGGKAEIVSSVEETERLPFRQRCGLVVQTTQRPEALREVAGALAERCRELRVFNTICEATVKRQESARELAETVDVVIVVGGRNSANTMRLAEICSATGAPTHQVETAAELTGEWLRGVQRVGITAGASTPSWIIEEVVQRLRDLEGDAR